MSRKPQLNRHEWLLLSAYLDGELSNREKRQVEEWLQTDPASRTALEGLRRTRQVLRHAPQKPVPHNFTLTEDMLRKPLIPSFSRVFSYSAALAGILLAAVLGMDLFGNMAGAQTARSVAAPAMESFKMTEDKAAASQETPQIIYWGNSGPLMGAYGKGGGGDGSGLAYGLGGGGGGSDSGYGIGGGGIGGGAAEELTENAPLAETEQQEQTEALPEMLPEGDSAPAQEAAPAAGNEGLREPPETVQEEAAPQADMGANAAGTEEEANSGPILGVRPADQRGSVEPQTRVQIQTMPEAQSQLPLRKAEIILALLAILLGLAAYYSRKLSG